MVAINTLFFPDISTKLGGPTSISNFLIVLLTYVYVVLTGMSVNRMVQAHKDENRPYIIADIEFKQHIVYVVLRNIGKLPAKNVRIKFEPELPSFNDRKLSDLLFSKPIAFFPPGKQIRSTINSGPEFLSDGNPREFIVTLNYTWVGQKKEVNENYLLNVDIHKHLSFVHKNDFTDFYKEFQKTNTILQKMSR